MEQPVNFNNQEKKNERKALVIKALLSISFLVLATLALLFALNANSNKDSAAAWEQLAQTRVAENKDLAKKLRASEQDVRILEERQSQLSSEKASAEDEKTFLLRLSSRLIKTGQLQQSCSNRLATLAEKISKEKWAWVERETGPIFTSCDQANLRFQSIASSLQEKARGEK